MRMLIVTLGVLAGIAGAREAAAFCRSTTCRATASQDCASDDDGCPTDGAKLRWPTSCVHYAMNELGTQELDPDETRDVIRKCFKAWTAVSCPAGGNASITFEERDPIACKKSEYNKDGANVNVVLFQDDDWKYRGIDGTLAKTSVTYNDQTGEIYDADIEVNAANNTVTITDDPSKVDYDLQSILTHEIGHFIGIAHSPDPSAVMFASYSSGSMDQRELTVDDVDAVCAVYPPNDGVVCDPNPRGGFSDTCATVIKEGCSVATVGRAGASDGEGAGAGQNGSTASLAVLGIGALGMLRLSRRSRPLPRRET